MTRMLRRRVIALVPTLLLSSIVVFALRSLIPGGPADAIVGSNASGQAIAAINRRLGLDHPIVVQYLNWLGGLFQGRFGSSYVTGSSVATLISERVGPSLELVIGALAIALIAGGIVGIAAAVNRHHFAGRAVLSLSALGLSLPDFWVATIAAGLFGLTLRLVPAVGFTPLAAGLGANLHSLLLPVLVLAIPTSALVTRLVHSGMVQALESPYIRTAWAMGIQARQVYLRCALRNAVSAVITFLPLAFAGLVGASVVVEAVFDIPGLGSEIVLAAQSRDYATLQTIVLMMALLVILLNCAADITVAAMDPRIRRAL
jgi:peptide/nickel transport system permease protein